MATNSIKLLTGNSHPQLARLVAERCEIISCAVIRILTISRGRLGIELTKIMVLQYSNQETSVTIGESVRDEDGTCRLSCVLTSKSFLFSGVTTD